MRPSSRLLSKGNLTCSEENKAARKDEAWPRIQVECHGSRHEPEYNILNGVVIEEGYVRVTMRVWYKDIWMKKKNLRVPGTGINRGCRGTCVGVTGRTWARVKNVKHAGTWERVSPVTSRRMLSNKIIIALLYRLDKAPNLYLNEITWFIYNWF